MDLTKYRVIIIIVFTLLLKPTDLLSKLDNQEAYGDSLLIGSFVKPTIINPILTHSSISAMLKGIIFDGLIKLNEKMEPVPHLALTWENSPDGLRWIFHLRKDVTFHDGAELTAEDVKFTFDKIRQPFTNSPYYSMFKNFEAVNVKDKYKLEIISKTPLPSLPFYLDVGILPKHLLMGKDIRKSQFNYYPIGTGPFILQHWSEEKISLKANKNYSLGHVHLNGVIVKSFKTQSIAWAELMRGNVDFVFPPYSENYDIIEKIPNFTVYSFLNPYYYILAFNGDNIFFRQKGVRQALNYGVDKERLVTKVLRGKARVSSGTIYPFSWAYDSYLTAYPYEPKKALELLKKAGWKDTNGNNILDRDGGEFEFMLLIVEGDEVARGCALQIQQQLLDIGMRMRVKPVSFSTMYERFLSTRRFDASLLTMLSDNPDRNYAWWHSSQIDRGFNVFSYKNKMVDELLDKGRTTLDREKSKRIYHQFQREIYEDPPGVFLFWRDHLIGIHKRFRGVRVTPVGILSNIIEWYVPEEEQRYR